MKSKKKTKGKRTAVYVRVSTLDQEKGIDSQNRALKEFCQNNGLNKRTWYRDRLSGKDTNRPAFKKLQKDIFNGKIHTVVVWKLDRISRSLQDGINILCKWLEKDKIRIIAITQQLDFSGEVGKMVAGILFAVAAMERENLRENTKRGIEAARARGAKLGKRPKMFATEIQKLLDKGMSIREIAERYKKTPQGVYKALKRKE